MPLRKLSITLQLLFLGLTLGGVFTNAHAQSIYNSGDERVLKIVDLGDLIIANDRLSTLELRSLYTAKKISLVPVVPRGFAFKFTKAVTLSRDEKKVLVFARFENSDKFWGDLLYIFDFSSQETEWITPLPSDGSADIKGINSYVSNRTLTRVLFSRDLDFSAGMYGRTGCFGGVTKSTSCLYEASLKNAWKPNFLTGNSELKGDSNGEMYPNVSEISDSGTFALTYGGGHLTNLDTLGTRSIDNSFGWDPKYQIDDDDSDNHGRDYMRETEHFVTVGGAEYLAFRASAYYYQALGSDFYTIYEASTLRKIPFAQVFPMAAAYNGATKYSDIFQKYGKNPPKNPKTGFSFEYQLNGLYVDEKGKPHSLFSNLPWYFPQASYLVLDWTTGKFEKPLSVDVLSDPGAPGKKLYYRRRSPDGKYYSFDSSGYSGVNFESPSYVWDTVMGRLITL